MKFSLLLFLLPFCAMAQQSQINKYMQAEFTNGFMGNVLVAKGNSIIYQKSFGQRNLDSTLILDDRSVFELASISKQFTAMGILLLEQKEKLKLTDTLRKFFPELPYYRITIYQLLNHTSGLPDYLSEMKSKWDHHRIAFNKDLVAFLAKEKPPVLFTPGTKFDYSNTGYALLASVIEKVSGESYHVYLDKNIFKPLHMHYSTVYNTRRSTKDTLPDYAYGYVYNVNKQKYIMPDSLQNDDFVYYLDGITGDGTVNSTTGDLLKWENALLDHTLLNAQSQQSMLSYHSLMDTINHEYYGYGVVLGKNDFGNYITHDGGWPGYRTSIIHYRESGYTIIVLSNNQSYATGISDAITQLLFEKAIVFPYSHTSISVSENILDNYTGKYLVPQPIELIKRGDKLYRHLPGAPVEGDVELKPESSTKFFYTNNTDVQLEFEVDSSGKMTRAYSIIYGIKKEIKKI